LVSFIVPAHDEEQLLGMTLAAVKTAAEALASPYEIIVVNDGSTDRTAQIAAEHGTRVLNVNLRQIAAVRNAGAAAASGDRLVFVDADTIVSPAVVRAAIDAMDKGAVGGGALLHWEGVIPYWARPAAALTEWSMRLGNIAAGCFVFVTRQAFEAVGGFDKQLYATEEITLSFALKRQGRFVVLRDRVSTSGRKLRTFSPRELLPILAGLLRGGLRDPRYLSLWYGKRRNEKPQ
jgi:glycosyltransferase involved in cell wall biosynthesis